MDSIFENYKTTGYLHHAHIVGGEVHAVLPALAERIEVDLKIKTQGNPDVRIFEYETLGVDEARMLKEIHAQGSFGGEKKIFIVGAQSLTREAQNALLKTFEEPTKDTHFFIVVPRVGAIIPTLLSRVFVFETTNGEGGEEDTLAQKFLQANMSERFTFAKKIGEVHDREYARRILDRMEIILAEKKTDPALPHEFYKVKDYMTDRGSSPKMLMENLVVAMEW